MAPDDSIYYACLFPLLTFLTEHPSKTHSLILFSVNVFLMHPHPPTRPSIYQTYFGRVGVYGLLEEIREICT